MDMSLSQFAKLAAAPPRMACGYTHKGKLSMTPIGIITDGGIDTKTTTSQSLVQSFCLGRTPVHSWSLGDSIEVSKSGIHPKMSMSHAYI